MTVIRPNSISGVSSITGSGGDISIFRADGTAADVIVNNITSGVITATTFKGAVEGNVTGSGANLTSIPAGQLTGTIADARLSTVSSSKLSGALPALDGSALTGVGVGTADSINTSGIVTATSFVPTTGQLSHRNIIVNGDMNVAQRGTSSASSGYQTVDRFFHSGDGWDAAMTQAQGDVASGTTPYTQGFRKTFKLTNGNQSSGAGAGDTLVILNRIEAQDLANSGWNYTSSSSNVSFSFWVKSSVAQNFFFTFKTGDGTPQKYAMETGSLTADTWTKITKTIPGNSNIQFDNDNGEGLEIEWSIFRGTDETGSMSLNAWAANNNSVRTPDQTSTWFTTNAATFEITGVQLEVGPVATPFEHRKFSEQLLLCQRYYRVISDSSEDGNGYVGLVSYNYDVNSVVTQVNFIPEMRATPTIASTAGTNYYRFYRNSGYVDINGMNAINGMGRKGGAFNNSDSGNGTAGQAGGFVLNNSSAKIAFDAEL